VRQLIEERSGLGGVDGYALRLRELERFAGEPEGLVAVGGDSEYDDVRLGLEYRPEGRAKELVVVGDDDSDGVGLAHRFNSETARC
jgi:hypothetical protein